MKHRVYVYFNICRKIKHSSRVLTYR